MKTLLTLTTGAVLALSACSGNMGSMMSGAAGPGARAQLQSTAGNSATGMVNFTQSGSKVMVKGEVRGLKPNAELGFHVHEKGDCSSPDGMSAGGHFNPDGKPHGQPGSMAHHAGDFPMLKTDAAGVAAFSFESSTISVGSGASDIVGKGLIVHAQPDDYKTQPTGNSGARLACAVITRS
jgi:superoxide dismutase, Cu-Zn family